VTGWAGSYTAYLRSPHWQRRRASFRVLHRSCRRCRSKRRLAVHHRTYRNLGHEPARDLVLLCKRCHSLVHRVQHRERISVEAATAKVLATRPARRRRR